MKELASISVIIVAFKVKPFISFCLDSISRASGDIPLEVIVVDNARYDGLERYLKAYHPDVIYLGNEGNVGFGAACNQGATIASGNYLLLLNPDTIVQVSLLRDLLNFVSDRDAVGIVSPLLLDGQGRVLSESARVKPSLKSALWKGLGIRKSRYGYYTKIDIKRPYQKIDVACGACMFIKKHLYDSIGGFDSRYFMYAEDIDLSIQSIKHGNTNYLLTDQAVLHFKGESTEKHSWTYNRHFYNSMASFVGKYIGDSYSYGQWILVVFVTRVLSITSFVWFALRQLLQPVRDAVVGLVILWGCQFIWSYWRYGIWDYFGYWTYWFNYFLYTGIWVSSMILGGAYLNSDRRIRGMKSLGVGIVISLVVYSLLPMDWRFSRMILVMAGGIMWISRFGFQQLGNRVSINRRDVIVLSNNNILDGAIAVMQRYLYPNKVNRILRYDELSNLPDETMIVFDMSKGERAIDLIQKYQEHREYVFWNPRTHQIISSMIPHTQGRRYDALSHHNLAQDAYRWQKRWLDVTIGGLSLIPIIIYQISMNGRIDLSRWHEVISGRRTLVGYKNKQSCDAVVALPPSILPCYRKSVIDRDCSDQMLNYSMHYSIFNDLFLILPRYFALIKAF